MSTPLFSVVLPTKNRSFLVGYAIQSVLQQSFGDWELVVVDNDDSTEDTRKVVESFKDPRVRYHRTGGLNMPDNWEAAIKASRGQYVLLIEDKQALKRHALAELAKFVAAEKPECVTWPYDTLDDGGRRPRISRILGGPGFTRYTSETLIDMFLNHFKRPYMYILPRGVNCCVRRDLIERIQKGPMGRICAPVTPDFTMAFLVLAYSPVVHHLHRSLSTIGGLRYSNGRSFKVKTELGKQFLKDFGRGESICYDLMPIKTLLVGILLANDYEHVRRTVGERLAPHPINMVELFVSADMDITAAEAKKVDMSEERQAWEQGMAALPPDVAQKIRGYIANGVPDTIARTGTNYFVHQLKSRYFTNPLRYHAFDRFAQVFVDPLLRPVLRRKASRG